MLDNIRECGLDSLTKDKHVSRTLVNTVLNLLDTQKARNFLNS
jgi:hypothetical protein